MTGRGAHHLDHILGSKAAERDPIHPFGPQEVSQSQRERVIASQFRVAVGDDDLQAAGADRAHDVFEQCHRLPVGPMEIVEYQAEGPRVAYGLQQPRYRCEQQEALGLWV